MLRYLKMLGGDHIPKDTELMARMRRLGHILHHKYHGMSQCRMLLILEKEGVMKQRELMERMHIQAGSLSEVINKVEAMGYIERVRCEDDKRNFDLMLTEAGRCRARQCERERDELAAELFSSLDKKQKNELYDTMGILLEKWSEASDCCMLKKTEENDNA